MPDFLIQYGFFVHLFYARRLVDLVLERQPQDQNLIDAAVADEDRTEMAGTQPNELASQPTNSLGNYEVGYKAHLYYNKVR